MIAIQFCSSSATEAHAEKVLGILTLHEEIKMTENRKLNKIARKAIGPLAREVAEIAQAHLDGLLDIAHYRDGQPIYCATRGTVDANANLLQSSANSASNMEYALLTRDDKVLMALKRETVARADAALQIVVLDSKSLTKHRLEVWNFVLSIDLGHVHFADLTPLGVDVEHIARACRNASWWRDWQTEFDRLVVSDVTLTRRQVAEARMVLDISQSGQNPAAASKSRSGQ